MSNLVNELWVLGNCYQDINAIEATILAWIHGVGECVRAIKAFGNSLSLIMSMEVDFTMDSYLVLVLW